MSDPMPRTVELVERAKHGEASAQNELFARYSPRLLPIVRARLRGKLRRLLDSQDIVQDVMMQAYGKLSDFQMRDECSFLHWLGKNAANKIRDYADAANADKRDIRREVELEAPMADDSRSIDYTDRGTPTPSQDARRREVTEVVAECLGELSEAHSELILMRNHAKMDWQAIGDALGIKPDAARQRHATARVALARLLQHRGLDDSSV